MAFPSRVDESFQGSEGKTVLRSVFIEVGGLYVVPAAIRR
jgi:hypothetical protein